jgi:hypothetical protein
MMTVTDAELLDLWEWGTARGVIERALALAAVVLPDRPIDELARQPVGLRNRCLLLLRESLFGPLLDLQTACPKCAEPLELQSPVAALTGAAPALSSGADETLEASGQRIHFRLPNSLDLMAAAAAEEPRRVLLERCVTNVEEREAEGETRRWGDAEMGEENQSVPTVMALTPETQAALAAKMQALDPLANPSFALTCPACGHAWAEPFDIASGVWTEIDAWAYRTLREIHWLASTYHWSEADILALGPMRRQAYLQMSGYA